MIWSDCFFLKECLFGGIAGLKLRRLLVSGSRKQRGLLRLGTRWQLGLKGWNTRSLYFENTTKTVLIVHLTKLRPNLTLQLCSFSNDFGFYNWAFGVPGNFSTSSNEETGERLHSGKPKSKIFHSLSLHQPVGTWGCREYLHYGSKGARDGSRVKDGTSSSQHMASIW